MFQNLRYAGLHTAQTSTYFNFSPDTPQFGGCRGCCCLFTFFCPFSAQFSSGLRTTFSTLSIYDTSIKPKTDSLLWHAPGFLRACQPCGKLWFSHNNFSRKSKIEIPRFLINRLPLHHNIVFVLPVQSAIHAVTHACIFANYPSTIVYDDFLQFQLLA